MAQWLIGIKDAVTNLVCRTLWNDPPDNNSPTSLDGFEELQVFSSDNHCTTTISLECSTDSSRSTDSSIYLGHRVEGGIEEQEDYKDSSPETEAFTKGQTQIKWKTCPEIPVRTKSAQGAIYENNLYLGGGYVNDPKRSSIVYKYDPIFEMWDSLPPCPLKLFGMGNFDQNLVLVGGKEVGNLSAPSTNKVVTWDNDSQTWNVSLPPMTFARLSPVVISFNDYLIVAGGKKGSLDYNVEVFDGSSKRWVNAPPLPTKCFPRTSAVSGCTWYLLNESNGSIVYADLRLLIQDATGAKRDQSSRNTEIPSENSSLSNSCGSVWQTLPNPPFKPDQITTISNNVLIISHESNPIKVRTFIYDNESESWSYSNKLPNLCGCSSALPDDHGGLFLFGGEGGAEQYSNKLYVVTLKRTDKVQMAKKTKPPLTFSLK